MITYKGKQYSVPMAYKGKTVGLQVYDDQAPTLTIELIIFPIFTTNANFNDWGEVFQDPKLANTILDRILHHATVVNIVGDSYRIKLRNRKRVKMYILKQSKVYIFSLTFTDRLIKKLESDKKIIQTV